MRSRLEAKGCRFSSECDTKVLLVAEPGSARLPGPSSDSIAAWVRVPTCPHRSAEPNDRLLEGQGRCREADLTPEAVAESESSCIAKKMADLFSAVVRLRRVGMVSAKNPEG